MAGPRHPQSNFAFWSGVTIMGIAFLALIGTALLTRSRVAVSVPVTAKQPRAPELAGRSFLPLPDGRTCRELIFDRVTNEIVESRTRACGQPGVTEEPDAAIAEGLNRGARNGFRWGQTAPVHETLSGPAAPPEKRS